MGADYSAGAVIGVCIPADELFKLESVPVRACECELTGSPDAKFCENCGERMWLDGPDVDQDRKDEIIDSGKFRGLDVICDTDDEHFYLGHCVSTEVSERGIYGFSALSSSESMNAVHRIFKQVREVLKPLGLWDASRFGLWAVLHCSY